MARLEGRKTSTGAMIVGAILFSLLAAGLFFAFRPAGEASPQPQEGGANATASDSGADTQGEAVEGGGSSTPLPTATLGNDGAIMDSNAGNDAVNNASANNASANAISSGAAATPEAVSTASAAPTAGAMSSNSGGAAPMTVAPKSEATAQSTPQVTAQATAQATAGT